MDRNETMVLTVLDADPHSIVHYQPDFYLSERRLSKRLQDADLQKEGSKIQWYASKTRDFKVKTPLGTGRYCTIDIRKIYNTDYTAPFYVQAQYNDGFPITVKFEQKRLPNLLQNITEPNNTDDLGNLKSFDLSDDQFNILQNLAPDFYTGAKTGYKIYKISDILSSYTFGHLNTEAGKQARRYNAAVISGQADQVGEHKRFSDMNNYNSVFRWSFFEPTAAESKLDKHEMLFFDFTKDDKGTPKDGVAKNYRDNYESKWFPKHWVRHMDSTPASPEIPKAGDKNIRKFNVQRDNGFDLKSYENFNKVPYEPWQVRLPWIAQSGLQGYRTRWNIKCIYDVNEIFNKDQVGMVWGLTDDSAEYEKNVIGENGSQIIPKYEDIFREAQVFYHMLLNKEIVVVKNIILNASTQKFKSFVISVADQNTSVFYEKVDKNTSSSGSRISASQEDELSAIEDETQLARIYPNPAKSGIFKMDVNIVQENSQVEFQLVDLTGKIIFNSLPEIVDTNYSTTIGEGLNLTIGIYFLKIKVNGVIEIKKLIVD